MLKPSKKILIIYLFIFFSRCWPLEPHEGAEAWHRPRRGELAYRGPAAWSHLCLRRQHPADIRICRRRFIAPPPAAAARSVYTAPTRRGGDLRRCCAPTLPTFILICRRRPPLQVSSSSATSHPRFHRLCHHRRPPGMRPVTKPLPGVFLSRLFQSWLVRPRGWTWPTHIPNL
jgi:hypothetical protein